MSRLDTPFRELEVVEHHGVKGMRWGVRRNRTGHIKARQIMKKSSDVESYKPRGYEQHFYKKTDSLDKTYSKARRKVIKAVKAINKDPQFKDKDLRKDSPDRRKYHEAVSKAVTEQLNAAAALKGNAKGGYRLQFEYNVEKDIYPDVTVRQVSNFATRKEDRANARAVRKNAGIRHSMDSSSGEVVQRLKPVLDATGHILDFKPINERGNTSFSDLKTVEHYGVKGMRWGVRRPAKVLDRTAGRSPRGRTRRMKAQSERERIRDARRKARADLKIAKINAKAAKQKSKFVREESKAETKTAKSGYTKAVKSPKDMSLDELKKFNERAAAEAQYKKYYEQANPKSRSERLKAYAAKKGKLAVDKAIDEMITSGARSLGSVVGEASKKALEKEVESLKKDSPKPAKPDKKSSDSSKQTESKPKSAPVGSKPSPSNGSAPRIQPLVKFGGKKQKPNKMSGPQVKTSDSKDVEVYRGPSMPTYRGPERPKRPPSEPRFSGYVPHDKKVQAAREWQARQARFIRDSEEYARSQMMFTRLKHDPNTIEVDEHGRVKKRKN